MITSKPTFVVVPGAWHPPSHYDVLISHLKGAGYPALAVNLPSLNSSDPLTATCSIDAKAVREQVFPLIETEGKDIVMVSHSYGGIPSGGAAYGLGKSTRIKDGKMGGVIGLVHMSSFIVPDGISLVDFLGGKHPPYLQENKPSPGLCVIAGAMSTLYGDVDKTVAEKMDHGLLPHALKAFESPAPPPAWAEPAFEGRIAFLKCLKDQALPTFVQDMFLQRSGVEWKVKEIEAGHSAYAARPQEVAEILQELVGEFEGAST